MMNASNYIILDSITLKVISSGLNYEDAKKHKEDNIIGYIDVTGATKIVKGQDIELPF